MDLSSVGDFSRWPKRSTSDELENGLERPGGRSRPAPRHLASLVVADGFAGELTRGSFKTIPASEKTTNTQRFEADSLAEGPGFEP